MPSINKAYHTLQQIEQQQKLNGMNTNIEMNAFNANKFSVSRFNPQQQSATIKRDVKKMKYDLQCDHYKRKGHLIDQCFKLIGYPEWWSSQKGKSNVSSTKMVANVNTTGILGSGPSDNAVSSSATGVDLVMVNNVYHEVVKMTNSQADSTDSGLDNPLASSVNFAGISQSNGFQFSNWIIDTGASNHMVCSLALFDFIEPLSSCINVKLPDGSFVVVKHSGNVKINSHITLSDVLYIPSFKHNLLSVSKLLLTHDLLAHFERDFCVF